MSIDSILGDVAHVHGQQYGPTVLLWTDHPIEVCPRCEEEPAFGDTTTPPGRYAEDGVDRRFGGWIETHICGETRHLPYREVAADDTVTAIRAAVEELRREWADEADDAVQQYRSRLRRHLRAYLAELPDRSAATQRAREISGYAVDRLQVCGWDDRDGWHASMVSPVTGAELEDLLIVRETDLT